MAHLTRTCEPHFAELAEDLIQLHRNVLPRNRQAHAPPVALEQARTGPCLHLRDAAADCAVGNTK